MGDEKKQNEIMENARNYARKNFSYEVYKHNLKNYYSRSMISVIIPVYKK